MKKLIALCASLLVTLSSHATLLTIDLDNTNYQIGDVIQANILISDIEQDIGIQKLVTTFEFDLLFDESLVAYQSTSFGSLLDADPFFPSDKFVSDSGFGSLNVSESSFAFSSDIFAVQNGLSSFILASVSFEALADGTNTFGLSNIVLGDEFGLAFNQVVSSSTNATIGNVTSVPETPTLAILALGLFALVIRKLKA